MYENELRPYFKGKFHAIAALIYILYLPILWIQIPGPLILPLGFYLFSVIAHFSASALLHLISWSDPILSYIRKLDHTMIFIKIAAIYYVGICTVIPDINSIILFVVIIGIVFGILMRIFFTDIPRFLISVPYVLMGWAFILDINIIIRLIIRIPIGFLVAVIGGVFYTMGAIIYIRKSPNPYPKYLGFHEIFHILSTIGTVLFTISIFGFVIPYFKVTMV